MAIRPYRPDNARIADIEAKNLIDDETVHRKINEAWVDPVSQFGAVGDGIADDTLPLQNAIAEIKTMGGGKLYLPPTKSFRITSGLRIDFSDFELLGNGALITTNTAVADAFIPILAQGTTVNSDVAVINNVSVSDVTIQHLQAGPNDSAAVQFNAVRGGTIQNVTIKGDGAGMANCKTDGIACAFGSRDIVISSCIVDGISKGGFYLAGCFNVSIIGSVAKNGYESLNPVTSGLNIGNARNCSVSNCHFYNNRGYGIIIDTGVGQFTATLSTLTDQTHFRFSNVNGSSLSIGSYASSGIAVFDTSLKKYEELSILSATPVAGTSNQQYDIVLNTAPTFTLTGSMTLYLDYYPARHVAIEACLLADNVAASGGGGVGFQAQTELLGAVPEDIVLVGCIASGSTYGFYADQISGLRMYGCSATKNGLNVFFQDIGAGNTWPDSSGAENLCRDVLISGGAFYDATSGNENIRLSAVNDIAIQGARIFHSASGNVGIKLFTKSVVTSNKPCANIRVIDCQFAGYTAANFVVLNTAGAAPSTGAPGDALGSSYYKVVAKSSPVASIAAPPGSEWVDATHALATPFFKATGDDSSGWSKVIVVTTAASYTVTNHSDDRTIDETGDTLPQVAHVLGTLINDLKALGVLS